MSEATSKDAQRHRNLWSIPKEELIARYYFRCQHRHNGLEHQACFDEATRGGERVGFFDIEATNLDADFGYMLCYCIKPAGKPVLKRTLTAEDIRSYRFDRGLCVQLAEDMGRFDRLIGFYSTKFDIPFVRTRCLKWKLPFPEYGMRRHSDCYYAVRNKLKLHRNRMAVPCEFLGIPAKEHALNPDVWMRAQAGHDPSLRYILTHCVEDVTSLEALWNRMHPFTHVTNRSM